MMAAPVHPPPAAPEDETAALAAHLDSPHTLLLVSDLHLSAGQDPRTKRYDRRENFFAADAFRALVESHDPVRFGPSVLVLNGDTFDFLRVTDIPKTDAEFEEWRTLLSDLGAPKPPGELRRIVRRERQYGLRTDDYKSAWKLQRIERGHPTFFDALAWWLDHDGTLVFVKGNHDLELYWPLVQDGPVPGSPAGRTSAPTSPAGSCTPSCGSAGLAPPTSTSVSSGRSWPSPRRRP